MTHAGIVWDDAVIDQILYNRLVSYIETDLVQKAGHDSSLRQITMNKIEDAETQTKPAWSFRNQTGLEF